MPTSGRDRGLARAAAPRGGQGKTWVVTTSFSAQQRPEAKRRPRSCMSSFMRGRSVAMDRPPVCEMVKRHEVWSPNPLAMGSQQSKSAGPSLTCAWRLVQHCPSGGGAQRRSPEGLVRGLVHHCDYAIDDRPVPDDTNPSSSAEMLPRLGRAREFPQFIALLNLTLKVYPLSLLKAKRDRSRA